MDRSVSISKRLKNFNAVVSSVAFFGNGHRAIYNSRLATLDVQFRKLCRSIVGPPPEVDWTAAWNEVLHLWNERVQGFTANAHVNTWNSRAFQINAGVRQGCVLSPKMFSSVLHWAMSKWRTWAEGCSFGFDLDDGLPPLLF